MTRFVALLRGINVGKAKRIAMVELRALLAGAGYTGVRTLLNSGNAVFDATGGSAPSHASAIEAAILARFGFEVPVVVKSARALAQAVADNPFAGTAPDPARLLVTFAQDAALLAALAGLQARVVPPEQFHVGPHAAYLHCAQGILSSPAGAALLGQGGRGVTSRNWSTVLKLHALASEGAG